MQPDDVRFFDALADEMNAHPERFERYGDADLVVVVSMIRPDGEPFRVRLAIDGTVCRDVCEVGADEARRGDFVLDGPVAAWREMFDDIVANGHATGLQTINSLALMGERIRLTGSDPMGVDKFSRFNQTLQDFFDGAARVAAVTAS